MELTELQAAALSAIRVQTQKDPITGANLATKIGLKPRSSGKPGADMRQIIHALRVKGYPICATGNGYWYPANLEQLDWYIESFKNRIEDQSTALRGLERSRATL